mmetsp:Transcript_42678/g.100123  ORF Transcript_42678/g.100123 Transcript_42678/m.100123 type:complete len:433 (+) Transcript_42678:2689-3987(+)
MTELALRKIYYKYHDKTERLSQKIVHDNRSTLLGKEVRKKSTNDLNPEEAEWISIDQVLNPSEWKHENGGNGSRSGLPTSPAKRKKTTWTCVFDREKIVAIWNSDDPTRLTDAESRCRRILIKYNGTFIDHVQRTRREGGQTCCTSADIHDRSRLVLHDLLRAAACQDEHVDSCVLHQSSGQRFPKEVLQKKLGGELEHIFKSQIFDYERAHKLYPGENYESKYGFFKVEEDTPSPHAQINNFGSSSDIAKQETILKSKNKKSMLESTSKKRKKTDTKEIVPRDKKNCIACGTSLCRWYSHQNIPELHDRQRVLSKEILRVRMIPGGYMTAVRSDVAASVNQGGTAAFHRGDLLHELTRETVRLGRHIRLTHIDKELHDVVATCREYVEVRALHGYTTCMWTEEARATLNCEHGKLVAVLVADEIVDMILQR